MKLLALVLLIMVCGVHAADVAQFTEAALPQYVPVTSPVTPEAVATQAQAWINTALTIITLLIATYAAVKAKLHEAGIDQLWKQNAANRTAADSALLNTPAPSQQPAQPATSIPPAVKVAAVAMVLFLASCAQLQSDAAKVKAWAASPTGQIVLSDVTTGLQIAAIADPSIAGPLQTVSLGVRSLETATAPTTSQITSAIQSVGGSAKAASIAAPLVSTALQSANGITPSAALESIATAADAAFAK